MSRISWQQYADLMLMLTGQQRDATSLAALFDMKPDGMRDNLRMLMTMKLVRIAKWKLVGRGKNNAMALFTRGGGTSVPQPTDRKVFQQRRPTAQVITFATMWRALEAEAHSPASLTDVSGVHINRAYPFMAHLRALGLLKFDGNKPCKAAPGGKPITFWRLCELDEGPAIHDAARAHYERRYAGKLRAANASIFTRAA
jgi:hypothetical protein